MKKAIIIFIFSILTLFVGNSVFAQSQTPSTVGKDFYVMFLRNDKNFPLSNTLTYFPDKLQLIITGKNTCTGTVTCTNPNSNFSAEFTVTPGQITTVDIPKNTSFSNAVGKQAGYTMSSGYVEDRGLHVTSTDSISLYAVNYCDASFDITNVLPTPALGDEYIIQNYKGIKVSDKYRPAEFVIVATEDNTTVDIKLTTKTGKYMPGESPTTANTYNAGQTIQVTLNKGQTYQLLAWSIDAFDGTHIKARDCKKIAVFQGCGISPVPLSNYGYEDHLYEQSIPTKYWGKNFIVTQTLQRANDRVKVTALNDGCTVTINGTLQKTLAARGTYEFEIVKDLAADTLQNIVIDKFYGAAHYIETSEPASVFLYLTGREYSSNTAATQFGDPSMVLITPVEQQIDYVTFSTFETPRVQIHHANIITETSNVGNMILDGNPIFSEFIEVPGNTDYSYARVDLGHGAHTLQCPGGGFAAHVYGFGQTAGKDESYAYTVGTGLKDINKQLFINGTNIEDIIGTFESCNEEDINFEVTTNMPFSHIEWIYGDNSSDNTNGTATHAYANAGDVELLAVIHWVNNDCETDTLRAYLQINDCTPPEPSGCVEITDLTADFISCSIGQSDAMNPFQYPNAIRDFGEASEKSRHTIVDSVATTATDPRTNGLTYYPPGENSSIRLGNWLTGHNSEAITFNMEVDSVSAPIVILKYACVMQNPQTNHTSAQQPRFGFRILDSNDNPINPDCMSAEYVAGTSTSGWHTTTYQSEPLLWKDWTTVGIDVSAYHGQAIKIQIYNCDCKKGDHFGYSYFHLSCAQKRFETNACGSQENFTYTAPVGFNYQWFFTDAPGTILSTSQTIEIQSAGNTARTLCCRCFFKEDNSCYFDIFTEIKPLFPLADFNFNSEGCSPTVTFTNASTISDDGVTPGTEPCETYLWNFGDGTISTDVNPTHTYASTGNFTVTLTAYINGNECSNDTQKEVSLNPETHKEITVDTCDVFEWGGYTCDTSGVYTHAFHTESGCDSIVTMHLTINKPYYHEDVREFCRSYVPLDFYYNGSVIATIPKSYTEETTIAYIWSADETFTCTMPLNDSVPLTESHIFQGQTVDGCDSTVVHTLVIQPSYRFKEYLDLCDSDLPYTWHGHEITESDVSMNFDIEKKTSVYNCDSIISAIVTLGHTSSTEFNASACDNYTWNDTTYTSSGDHIQHFENKDGCDSTVTMHLAILRNDIEIDSAVCEKLEWNGHTYTTNGPHTEKFENQYGCDSVVTINLTILRDSSEFTQEACGEFVWNEIPYTTSGNHIQHFTNKHNCDSTVTMHLTIHPVYDNIPETRDICANELPYTWYPGVVFTYNGEIKEDVTLTQEPTLHSIHNCDSTVAMTLIVHPIYDTTDTRTICEDELPYDWDGVIFTHAFTQSHKFKNQYDCDSTVAMTLIVNPHDTTYQTRTICESELPYEWTDGIVFSGPITEEPHTITSSLDCDSTIFMTLVVNPIHEVYDTATICDNFLPYKWDNIVFTEAGSGIDSLKNTYGCDSVVHKTLFVNPTYKDIYDTLTICQNELPYDWKNTGVIFPTIGTITETDTITQTHTLHSIHDCDSTVTMTLIVHPMYTTTDSKTICESELPFNWNGVWFDHGFTQTHKFQTIHGCDSIVTMTLNVNPVYENETDKRTICDDKLPYIWEALLPEENVTFTEAGVQTHTLTSSLGCDSTVTMTLEVNPTFKEAETREICADEMPYIWYSGVMFTYDGEIEEDVTLTQEPTLHTVNNCDSIVTMTLTVHPTYNTSDEKTICEDDLPYEWNGVIFYEETNDYAHLKTIYGCDSIVGLTLHVNPHDTVPETRNICYNDLPYEWYPGIVFNYDGDVTESVTLNETHTITSSHNCDSTVHMTLIIKPIYENETEKRTICDDKLPYTWEALLPEENVTFTEAGVQTHTLTSSLGCDSTVTMTLVVNPTFKETDTKEICADEMPYTWYPGVVFTYDGEIKEDVTLTQEPTLHTVNNCDSTVTMTLIIHPTYIETDSKTICFDELPFDWSGVMFEKDSTITHKFQTIHGCDSIVTMTLHVNPVYENSEPRTICDDKLPYTWEALLPEENVTFTEAGVQTHTLTSSLGCDSTVTMTLNVNPTFKETDTKEICADEMPFTWYPGVVFTYDGDITEDVTLTQEPTLHTINNCDSTVTMTLIVHPTYIETDLKTTCFDELPFDWSGVMFEKDSTITHKFQTIHGCDSIVSMTLIVYPHDTVPETRNICYNDLPYEWYPGIVFNYDGDVTESVTLNETHTITSSHNCDSTVQMTLIINPIYEIVEKQTICDSELDYEWHDSIFTGPVTDYPMVFHSTSNCDSTYILTLVVNPTYLYEEEQTICESELPYKWHEYTFTEAGYADTTFQSQKLCDSTYKMTLHVNPIYNLKDTATICASLLPYTWDNIIFDNADTQIDSLKTKLGCDSVVEKTLIVNEIFTFYDYDTICDSELGYEWHDSIFTGPVTDYPMVFHSADNCDSTLILTLVVHPTYDKSETRTICSAQLPYEWNGLIFHEAADSIAVLKTINNCDSVVGMKLIVNPTYDSIPKTQTICDDQLPYYWDNDSTIVFHEAGMQVHTFTSSLNCDSTVYMTLTVNKTYAYNETDTICDSELPYTWHEYTFYDAGTADTTFVSEHNCDSTYHLTLFVMPTYNNTEDSTICASELPLMWHEHEFTEAGTYTSKFESQYGCDSIHNMTLFVNPIYDLEDSLTICDDLLPYTWAGVIFNEAGTLVDSTLTTTEGCDSIVTKHLTVNKTYAYNETDTICDSELPYTWHEYTFYEAGTADTTFVSEYSCDSSYHLTLFVMPTYNNTEDSTICASELPLIWHEHEFTEAGTYTSKFESQYGCDSIHNMTLFVNPIYDLEDSRTICDDLLPYTWNGVTFTEAGTLVDSTLTTTEGCDSIVTKHLTVNKTYAYNETDTICDSELPYTWHEYTFYEAGTADTTFVSEHNCDSTYHLTLFVMPTYNYTEDSTICASELPLMWHEHEFTEADTYTSKFESQYGCDSIHNMTLFVNPIYDLEDSRTICDDLLPYTWNGVTFTEAGTLVDSTLTTTEGCDSIVTKHLTVNPTYTYSETDTICDSELPYIWHEYTFYEAGTADTTFVSEHNCDSTYHLTLFVMPTYNNTEDSTICASELPLMWHEHEFTEAGTYTSKFESQYGCDSIHNMTLFVNPIYDLEDSRTICDDLLPYTWNGVTFTEAGTLVDSTLTTTEGCDSIVTKHLTVNPTKTFEFDVEVCDQYTWNDETYNTSGDYEQSFLTTLNCDSTVTLHLTVNHSTTHSFDTIACEEFVWNGIPYTESGDIVQNLHTVHNCDSIVTAHLTIGHHTPAEIFIDACDSYSIEDSVYTVSGTYEQTINTVLGCDSIITLHLTLDYTPDADIFGDHWVVGGSETNISKYHYYVVPTHDVVVIDTVEWFIDCPNWHVDPIGNGEHSDLYIHTFLPGDSIELRATVYSNCGSATQSIWIHTSYFGVDEETSNSSVVILPNPNKGDMTIRLENIIGDATIYVYDLLGNTIDKFRINNRDEVALIPYSLKTKAEATYTFVIVTDIGTFTRKVVVGNK